MTIPTASQITSIESLYVAYFNRPADSAGLAYWADRLANSANPSQVLDAISTSFSQSPEYLADYGGKTSTELVNAVYENLFGRPADPKGLLFYSTELSNGTVTISDIVKVVAGGAQNSDKVTYDNKVEAATKFTASLTDTQSILAYNGADANVIVSSWLAGVTTNESLTTQLGLIPNVIVQIETPLATTHTLTTAQDSVNTTIDPGASTVYGNFGNAMDNSGIANTYTPNDSIIGNSQTTLNLADNNTGNVVNLTAIPTTVTGVGSLVVGSTEAVIIDTFDSLPSFSGLNSILVDSVSGYFQHGYNNVDTITAAATTSVLVNDAVKQDWQSLGHKNGLTVNGGSTVVVNEDNQGHVAEKDVQITVNGFNGTSSVAVNQTGVYANNRTFGIAQRSQDVLIQDWASNLRGSVTAAVAQTEAATLTDVTLTGLFWAGAKVASDALTNLTINDSSESGVELYNYGNNTNSVTALNLNLNNDADLGITDKKSAYIDLNVTTGPVASSISLENFNALTTLAVTGASVLTVDPVLPSLQTITVADGAGSAGFIDLDLYGSTKLKSVDATKASGVVAVLGINAGNTTFAGGTGPTLVGITADATKSINAGTSPLAIAVLEANGTFFTQANTTKNVTGFSTLGTDGYSSGTYVVNNNPTYFPSLKPVLTGINSVNVISNAAGNTYFVNANDSTTLQFSGQEAALWTGSGKGNAHYTFLRAEQTSFDVNALNVTLGVSTQQSDTWAGALSATTHVKVDTLALGNQQGLAVDGTFQGTPIQGILVVDFNSVGADGTWGHNTIDNLMDQQLASLTLTGNYGLQIDYGHHLFVGDQSSLDLTDNGTSAADAKNGFGNRAHIDETGLVFKDGIYANELNTLNLHGTDTSSDAFANSITIGTLAIGWHGNESNNLVINDDAAGNVYIGQIWDQQEDLHVLTLNNTGTADLHLGGIDAMNHRLNHMPGITFGADNLNTVNLSDHVSIGSVDVDPIHGFVYGYQPDAGFPGLLFSNDNLGFLVNGGADNSNVAIGTCGAQGGYADTFVLGNGNNFLIDQSGAATDTATKVGSTGTVNITVGTGANLIVLGNDTANYDGQYYVSAGGFSNYNVTIGGGTTANDIIDVSSIDQSDLLAAKTANNVITGAHFGTLIGNTAQFYDQHMGDNILIDHNAVVNDSSLNFSNNVAFAITQLFTDVNSAGAGHVAWATINQGTPGSANTYLVENLDGSNFAVVELVGQHTLAETQVHGVNYVQATA